ncbi:MAG: iron-sulfur cluster repair di-iron protein [Planctomycetaceae bacterium]|nr:iron-sulfur cluster repair di-iron protein [Planctomycetaceae bacterium]
MSTLTADSSVGQWAREQPRSARIFEELQIDYCCGGGVSLAVACDKKRLDPNSVMAKLRTVIADSGTEHVKEGLASWSTSSLTQLCDHIEETHHAYLRSELPRLTVMIEKVAAAHGAQHVELPELLRVFLALRAELEPHMMKEEQILFPAIRTLEQAANRPAFPFGTVANPIRMMEHEHGTAGIALAMLRELTRDYLVPDGACNTYRAMLDSLGQLERDLHQHIHKENNILFPKALELERTLAANA